MHAVHFVRPFLHCRSDHIIACHYIALHSCMHSLVHQFIRSFIHSCTHAVHSFLPPVIPFRSHIFSWHFIHAAILPSIPRFPPSFRFISCHVILLSLPDLHPKVPNYPVDNRTYHIIALEQKQKMYVCTPACIDRCMRTYA